MGLLKTELLRGTLDMLVLKALTAGPIHGWGLAERLEALSSDVFTVNRGSLYPALQRLRRAWGDVCACTKGYAYRSGAGTEGGGCLGEVESETKLTIQGLQCSLLSADHQD